MQKFGRVVFQNTGYEYMLIWTEGLSGFERIDVAESFDDYNFIDTSSCVAAYYKKQSEMFLGDEEIIKSILRTRSSASVFKSKMVQTVNIVDGKIVISQSKDEPLLGMKYELVTVNGLISKELYQTPEVLLEILSVDKDKGIDIPPINIDYYKTYSILNDKYEYQDGPADYYPLEYLRNKYPLDHIEENDFVVVTSMEIAKARLKEWALAPTKIKAVDLEGTGLETGMYGQDVITGVVMSYSETDSTYYPFRQENFDYNLPISFLQEILDTIRNQPADVVIVAHNGIYEIKGIWKEESCYIQYSDFAKKWNPNCAEDAPVKPNIRIDADSMVLSILVNPVFQRGLHALKSLAYKVTGNFYLDLKEHVFKDKNNIKFNVLPPELVKYYACPDTANTIKVYKYLLAKLPKDEYGIYALENRLVYVKAVNEFYGMCTNKDLLVKSLENEEYKVNTLSNMFKNMHHTSKNINSNDVRRDIFYNKLRCPVEVRTKTGMPSTSNVALSRLVDLGTLREYDESRVPPPIVDLNHSVVVKGTELASNRYPSLVILNKYAKATKELGAFKRIQRKSLRDRVMFGINQAGAASGRQTSDAHQYSDGMKKLIIADSKQHWLWSADFKQIELRILAYLAGQQDLIELECDQDVDIHRAILSIIMGLPIWAISAKMRKDGKSTNFGVVYMMSEFGLALKNAGPAYTKDDLVKALASINGFYNGLPKIKALVKSNEDFVRANGYMKTKFGRYRYFKEILDPTLSERQIMSMVRAANNTPVQGFGADYLKIVEVNIQEYICKMGWDEKVDCDGTMLPKVRLMLSIHDEVLVSTHKDIPIEDIITMFKECMELEIKGAPPFFAAPAMVGSWYDGKLDQYEIDLRFRDEIIKEWKTNRKRILHASTFCEEFDRVAVDDVNATCRELRKRYLTPEDEKNITDETVDRVLESLPKEAMTTLRKHFISEYDVVTEDSANTLAVRRALDESFSHYLYDLSTFRSKRLKEYMDGLVKKYKTSDEVAAHVQHPELTHTLISVFIKKDEKFAHTDAIVEATKRYMDKKAIDEDSIRAVIISEAEDRADDKEILRSFDQLEEYIQLDANGEVIFDEPDSEDLEEDDMNTVVEHKPSGYGEVKRTYSTYALSDVIIDLSDFRLGDVGSERVNQEIGKLDNKAEYYSVVYFINNKLIKTPIKIGYIPEDIDKVIETIKEDVII